MTMVELLLLTSGPARYEAVFHYILCVCATEMYAGAIGDKSDEFEAVLHVGGGGGIVVN